MLVHPRKILENILQSCPNPDEFLQVSGEIFRNYADELHLRYLQEWYMHDHYLLDTDQTQWYFDQIQEAIGD